MLFGALLVAVACVTVLCVFIYEESNNLAYNPVGLHTVVYNV